MARRLRARVSAPGPRSAPERPAVDPAAGGAALVELHPDGPTRRVERG